MYAEPADAWNHSKSAAGAVQSQASQVVAPLGAWLRVTCGDLLGHGRVVGDAGVPAARAAKQEAFTLHCSEIDGTKA